ncbi:MAG: hypothetical protein WDZ83_19020 [Rhizobiaceae bacterium]
MTSQYQIIISNLSDQAIAFYAFQEQAAFTNSGVSPTILSSCLATGTLAPQASSGSQLDFGFDTQNYVGAISNIPSSSLVAFNASISQVGAKATSSATSAIQPIELTPAASGQADNFSTMTISPLGLSAPRYQSGPRAGYFGVQVPSYSPAPSQELYCGCAAINQDGSITLSSFVAPLPNSQVDCATVAIYHVKVGSFPVGQVITYDTGLSAKCDFTTGVRSIAVDYHKDGSFSTTP